MKVSTLDMMVRVMGVVLRRNCTLAAERQDPDFLIGPRNEKQRKKRTAVKKILYPPFQITSWHFG
jgi:hypothetical protein